MKDATDTAVSIKMEARKLEICPRCNGGSVEVFNDKRYNRISKHCYYCGCIDRLGDSEGWFFVYGTLKVGGGLAEEFNFDRVEAHKATIKGSIYKGPFPMLVLDKKGVVHGELHRMKHLHYVLPRMDQMEGYKKKNKKWSLYLRRTVVVNLREGLDVEAYVYEFNTSNDNGKDIGSKYKRIESGVWELPEETTFDENWEEENVES